MSTTLGESSPTTCERCGTREWWPGSECPHCGWTHEMVDLFERLKPYTRTDAPDDDEPIDLWPVEADWKQALFDFAYEAAATVADGRSATYGRPSINMERTASLWTAMFPGCAFVPREVALAMIGVKLARLQETPDHRDSLVDIIGWTLVYVDCLEEE